MDKNLRDRKTEFAAKYNFGRECIHPVSIVLVYILI